MGNRLHRSARRSSTETRRTQFPSIRETSYHPVGSSATPFVQRLSDWLQEHPTFVAILAPGGSALCALGVRYAPNGAVITLFLVLLALCASTPSLAARVNRLQQGRRAAEDCMKRLLQACAHSFGKATTRTRTYVARTRRPEMTAPASDARALSCLPEILLRSGDPARTGRRGCQVGT